MAFIPRRNCFYRVDPHVQVVVKQVIVGAIRSSVAAENLVATRESGFAIAAAASGWVA